MKKLPKNKLKKLRVYRASDEEETQIKKNHKEWLKKYENEIKISLSRFKVEKMLGK